MKKLLAGLILLMLAEGGSALDLGMGWGALVDISPLGAGDYASIGACGFFDATYAQISAGYVLSQRTIDNVGVALSWLDAIALAKYPFKVGPFAFFPLLGVEFELNLSYVNGAGLDLKTGLTDPEKENLNALWLEAGVGIDYIAYTDAKTDVRWYIRLESLFGFNPLMSNTALKINLLYGCIFPTEPGASK